MGANILEGNYEEVLASVQSPVISLTELIKNSADSSRKKDDLITVNIDTASRKIQISDSGIGLSQHDLKVLGQAGYSDKMVADNLTTPAGTAYSGSKGLGLLTAFFISSMLEIETYSEVDKKAYYLKWEKGDKKYRFSDSNGDFSGTTVTLSDVDQDKLDMILLPEERQKLFMSSVEFYKNTHMVPRLKLIVDGMEEDEYPKNSFEEIYAGNKKSNQGFVAKGSFNVKNNIVTLSYEDNVTNFFNFSDLEIDLKNVNSVEKFITNIKAPENTVKIRKISDSVVFTDQFIKVALPEFSGEFYTWRGKKQESIDPWPYGIRIYINNYSLYRYLDKDNDWLNLSEISQNIKATNYKLKNTYGFVEFNHFNESESTLKISKERNDFIDSLSQRKFLYIMRDIVAAVFSRIDIASKNPPVPIINLRYNEVTLRQGENFDLNNVIVFNNIPREDIQLEFNSSEIQVDDEWKVTAKQAGLSFIKIVYGDSELHFSINFKKIIPEFELMKQNISINRGNTINLRDLISPKNLRDTTIESISITPENNQTIINDDLFDKANGIGMHTIVFSVGNFQKTLYISVIDVPTQPGSGAISPRIESMFPTLQNLKNKNYKIPELIEAISSYYISAPTLCMAAIRILVESSCKEFFTVVTKREMDSDFPQLVSKILNMRDCDERNPDYRIAVETQSQSFMDMFNSIAKSNEFSLSKDVKKNINNHLSEISLNAFIHNPKVYATDVTVYNSMQILSPLLNFIFEIILIEEV